MSYIQSYDFDLQGQGSEGDFFLSVSRFIPDFKTLIGTADVTLALKRYPSESDTSSTYSPFTITSTPDKIDTRARGRYVNVKVENTGVEQSWRYGTLSLDVKQDGGR